MPAFHLSFLGAFTCVSSSLVLRLGRSLKKTRLVETLDTTFIFSGLVLSREWSLAWILLLDNEITREMHDKDK